MGTQSPYINPLWPDAVWDVSGAFANDRELISFFDFCKLVLQFEPFHIVHGSPLCIWNSGRVVPHLLRENGEIVAAGIAYEKRKIALYLTFTNLLLEEKHLNDISCNELCKFALEHNPTKRNSVIVGSDLLRDYLRKEYPDLRLVSSILKVTKERGKGNMDVYKRLADEYDEVMVHPDDVRNYDFLEKIEDKDRHILLVNEYCIRNCPLRPFHYDSLSHSALDFLSYDQSDFNKKQSKNGCLNLFTLLTDEHRSVLALNTPEIQRLRDMGFTHFKLQGRGHANSGPTLFDLLRLALRNDEADENAMHALCLRFFESILPIQ